MNREAIVRGVRMLKIVKAGSNGLRKLHTSNKVRGTAEPSLHAVSLSLSLSSRISVFSRTLSIGQLGLEDWIGFSNRRRVTSISSFSSFPCCCCWIFVRREGLEEGLFDFPFLSFMKNFFRRKKDSLDF